MSLQDDVIRLKELLSSEDTQNLIEFSFSHNYKSRMKISNTFIASFGEDLIKVIKDSISKNDYKDTLIALFTPRMDYICQKLNEAIEGLGTDEDTLIEIISPISNQEAEALNKRYLEKYNVTLEKDIVGDTSENLFRQSLLSLIQGQRRTNTSPNESECQNFANQLYNFFKGDKDVDKSIFIQVFSAKSQQEIILIVKYYYKLAEETILESIKNKYKSGDIYEVLYAMVYSSINPAEYFATLLNKYIEAKKKDKLLRILIIQYERKTMKLIKIFYRQLYRKNLEEDIKEKWESPLKDIFLKLIEC